MIDIKEKKYSGCLHPMVMRKVGVRDNGKGEYKFLGAFTDPAMLADPELQVIPCGHCINCRLKYSRQWADRLMLEKEYHEHAWFVTLTYNNFFVPTSYWTDENTGELIPSYSLYKRDVQLFLKRLREMSDKPLRFYCAGEYGENTFRPHYHLIIFGLELDENDLYDPRRGHSGFTLWRSHLVERAWSKILFDRVWPIGNVIVAPVTWQTCAYVSRYVTKKLYGELAEYYNFFNIEPPFSTMSRKPGIAKQYYLDHPEFMEKGRVCLSTPDGSKVVRIPKYFDKLFEVDFPEESAKMKEVKAIQARRFAKAKFDTDLSLPVYLSQEEERAQRIAGRLIRDEVD